ncbi:MAG TPA: transposase, partial [Nannocystaceae bacterium]|nr:transposase [Nannocystaceae bacterium]
PAPHSATALSPHSATSPDPPFVPLTDAQWARVIPLVAADRPRRGPPIDLRRLLDGVRWILHHRARWHDLPAAYGTPTTAWRWHKRWTEDDTWTRLLKALA